MAVARCPECRSPDIKLTAPGLLRNSYLCNSCEHSFTRRAPTWFVTVGGIGGWISALVSLLKEVFSDDPNVGRPEASAPLPPRQPPQSHPTPPVHPKRHSALLNRLDSHKAVAFNDRGVTYCEKGALIEQTCAAWKTNLDRGIAYFNHAIELNPDYVQALNNRGYAYNLKREYTLAINDLDRAIELSPDNATVFYNRADVYFIQGLYPLCVRDLDQAIKLNPNFADAIDLRCHARGMAGDIIGAMSDAASAERAGARGHNAFLPGPDARVNRIAQGLTMSASFTDSSTIQVNWTTDIWTIGFVVGASATPFALNSFPMFSDVAGGYGTSHSTVLAVPSGVTPLYVSVIVKTIRGIFSHREPSAVSATIPVPQSPRPNRLP